MKKEALKRQILVYLLSVFGVDVVAYVALNSLYISETISKSQFQSVFYGVGLFMMPFFFGWLLFGAAYVIVRKCRNCSSKNVRYAASKRNFVCDDCGNAFKFDLQKDTKIGILAMAIPLLFVGPSFLLGGALAGEMLDSGLVFFSILLSSWLPSFLAEIVYSIKLNNSTFVKEHQMLGLILLIISFFVLPFLMLIGYGMIIAEILKILGILH